MPDLKGFTYEPQRFEGLYKLGDDIQKERFRNDQMQKQQRGNMMATSKFLTDYLDPKEHLTGTNYDPQIVKGYQDLLQKGMELAQSGADTPSIMMALGTGVGKLNEYSTKAKLVNQRIKDQLQQIKSNAGYNTSALEQEAKKAAFYGEDGQLKDISSVDPDTDWITEVVKNNPEKVTTDAGIDEFVKNSPKYANTKDVTTYNPMGGMSKSKKKVTAPAWLTEDTDERGAVTGLVPKHQIAIDGGNPITHDFKDEKGDTVKAPVRLLDEQEFKSLMASNPSIADYVRGQVKNHLSEYKTPDGKSVDINSPQATMVARAILYDELNRRRAGSMEDIEIQNKPSSYQIKSYLNIPPYKGGGSGNSSGDDVNVNDLYSRVKSRVYDNAAKGHGTRFNSLPSDEQSVILDFVNKGRSTDSHLTPDDIFLRKNSDGSVEVYKIDDTDGRRDLTAKPEFLLTTLPEIGTNLKAQPGVKEKRAVIERSKTNQVTQPHKKGDLDDL